MVTNNSDLTLSKNSSGLTGTQSAKKSNSHDVSETRSGCPRCKTLFNISTKKAEPKSGVELILHEEKCMDELLQIIGHFNRHMFSSFQVELFIPKEGVL